MPRVKRKASEDSTEEPKTPPQKPAKKPKKDAAAQTEQEQDEKPKRICATTARKRYGLSDAELGQLKCEYVRNPHYASAAPMRLYEEVEVIALAEAKEKRKKYEAEHAEEIAAQKAEEARQRRLEAAARARTAVAEFSSPPREVHAGSTPLPQEVWNAVFLVLGRSLDPSNGLRGPTEAARDIANAALTCRDMYHASSEGLRELNAQAVLQRRCAVPQAFLDADAAGWARWDGLVHNPTKHTVQELKQAARELHAHVTGTKAELVLRVLAAVGLEAPLPPAVPLRLRLIVQQERQLSLWDLRKDLAEAVALLSQYGNQAAATAVSQASYSSCGGLAAARRTLLAAFGSEQGLTAAYQPCKEEQERRRALEEERLERQRALELQRQEEQRRAREQQRQWQAAAAAAAAPEELVCVCGNTASPRCSALMCCHCCSAPCCPRHGRF